MAITEPPLPRLMPWKPIADRMCADGAKLRPLAEVLGDADGFHCFSDYRVEDGTYATSTLYVTTEPHWNELVGQLEAIRGRFGVKSHALQYKSRRNWNRLWPEAIAPWLAAFRETAGLVICIARTRRLSEVKEYRDGICEVARRLENTGITCTWSQLEALVWKLTPFFVAAPLLRNGVLVWYSDFDAMLRGETQKLCVNLALENLDYGGADVSLVTGFWDESKGLPVNAELALSLPDLVSGVLADRLTSPFVPGPVSTSDDPAGAVILEGLAEMGKPFRPGGTPCKLYIGMLDRSETGPRYQALDITRAHQPAAS